MAAYKNGAYYLCKIKDQSFTKANSGTVGLKLVVNPIAEIEYQNPDTRSDCASYERPFVMWLTEKSAPLHKEFLKSLGFSGKFSELDSSKEDFYSLVGKEICLQNTIETRDGNSYDRLDYPRPPVEKEEIEASEIDKFN